jgi:uncharacterized protein YbjT (DUF2867 family)
VELLGSKPGDGRRVRELRVLIFGGTGMVGSGVLLEALESPDVTSVVSVTRRSTGRIHAKLEEVVHDDFFDYSAIGDRLNGIDACFFCLGVSAAGKSEDTYYRLTYDLTVTAADALLERNPDMTFCYVSGAGTDSSESGRMMWARVKGKLENKLLDMPLGAAYMFRPGYIQPLKGVRSRTRVYALMYGVVGPLYPLLKRAFPRHVTDSVTVGRAMLLAAQHGFPRPILETWDINDLGTRSRRPGPLS